MSDVLIDFLRGADTGKEAQEILEQADSQDMGEVLPFDVFNDNYTEIDPDPAIDEPDVIGSWVFPPVYKLGAHGDTLRYQIGYNHISKKLLWTVGRVETGGLLLYNTDVVPTKAQKGSFQRKAYSDALTRLSLKLKNGFHLEVDGTSALAIPLPMLANKYRPPEELSEGNAPQLPLAAQAKFDGERHLVFFDRASNSVKQMTRQMNIRPYFEHIKEECKKLLEFLPGGTILDGELYSNKLTFQMMTSIAGVKNGVHPREKEMDYYIFDIYHPDTVWRPGMSKELSLEHPGEGDSIIMNANGYSVEEYEEGISEYYELPEYDTGDTYPSHTDILVSNPLWVVEIRISLLMNAFLCYRHKYGSYPRYIKMVKTYILNRRDDIDKLFKEMRYLDIGGPEKLEGIMLRHLARGNEDPLKSLYRPGRSDNLLKVKGLNSTEVVITGVRAGRGRAKDLAILVYKEPDTGITGTVVPAATHEERRAMLLNPELVKGKIMTVSYQNRMKSGAMRFPVGLAFIEGK